MSIVKSIVSGMLSGLRLNYKIYDSWHRKIQYLLNKNETIDFITKEVISQVGNDPTDAKWYEEEVQKD